MSNPNLPERTHSAEAESVRLSPLARLLGLLDPKPVRRAMWIVLGLAAIGLGVVDVIHHRHEIAEAEGLPGFYAVFGFLAFTFVVLSGWVLRRVLSRPETYYGEDGDG